MSVVGPEEYAERLGNVQRRMAERTTAARVQASLSQHLGQRATAR